MKRIIFLIVSHLVFLGAGLGLHWMMKEEPRKAVAEPKPEAHQVEPKAALATLPAEMKAGDSPWSAADLRKAWRALGTLKIPPGEMEILRKELFKEWAAKDLRSALMALTDEKTLTGGELQELDPMRMIEQSDDLFDWIMAGDFGLDGRDMLRLWGAWGMVRNPERGIELMDRVPPALQETFFQQVFGGVGGSSIETRVGMIAKLSDERQRTLAWRSLLEGAMENARQRMGPDRTHELLAMEGIPKEARERALGKYVETLMGTAAVGESASNFRRLSAEDQRSIGPRLLDEAERRSFSAETLTSTLSLLMESGQWDLVSDRGPAAVKKVFEYDGADTAAMAQWAQELPPRDEAKETYRLAVSGRFGGDLNGSQDWVLSLPEGWHRDQALAQLAKTADGRKNAGARDQAIGAITDPAIQEEMGQWRQKDATAK